MASRDGEVIVEGVEGLNSSRNSSDSSSGGGVGWGLFPMGEETVYLKAGQGIAAGWQAIPVAIGGRRAQSDDEAEHIGLLSSTPARLLIAGLLALLVFVPFASRGDGSERPGEGEGVLAPAGASGGASRVWRGGEDEEELSLLRGKVGRTWDTALDLGLLRPITTTVQIVHAQPPPQPPWAQDPGGEVSEGGGQGLDFIVSTLDASHAASKLSKATFGDAPAADPASYDPFAVEQRDYRMQVASIPPNYALLLNKYPTMRDHVLLVPNAFEEQGSGLSRVDVLTLWRLVDALPAVGFFNSGLEAGASQRHKHLQLIPLDVVQRYREEGGGAALPPGQQQQQQQQQQRQWGDPPSPTLRPLPLEDAIARRVAALSQMAAAEEAGAGATATFTTLPEFRFRHALALLPPAPDQSNQAQAGGGIPPREEEMEGFYDLLFDTFERLLATLDLSNGGPLTEHQQAQAQAGIAVGDTGAGAFSAPASAPAFNVLLCREWLLVVPRSRQAWLDVEVNGLGFIGALLVQDERQAEAVREVGPMAVLEGVTVPL